ncbi:MAG: PH domain-containing protein, partial [Smithella sp.]
KVESISVKRTLMGMMFGFGTVTITGSGGTRESFPSIDKPNEFRKRVNDQLANYNLGRSG